MTLLLQTYQRNNIVANHTAEQILHHRLQSRCHLLQLADQIDKKLRHVLLFGSVERLVVHCVHFAETTRVIRLPFALQKIREHSLQFFKS